MSVIAALPMYDAPPEALDTFWRGLRLHLAEAGFDDLPETLAQPDDLDAHWRAADLLLSQTCGYPFSTTLRAEVTLVATPHYAAPGCDGPFYRSAFVVRADDPAETVEDLRGRRAAFNDVASQSGYNALRAMAAPLARDGRFFGEVFATGAHSASLALVAEGRADIAAIDCVTFALAARDRPETVAPLRVLAWSEPSLGLPLITSKRLDADALQRLRAAVFAAFRDPELESARRQTLLSGVSVPPESAYDVCREAEATARALGYPQLA